MTTGGLERVIQRAGGRRREPGERCDLCGVEVPERHRHVLDTERGEVMCTCVACGLLFDRDAASNGHYRLVPRRRARLAGASAAPLGVPVGLAFFVVRPDGTIGAHYPSPMGATEWEVDPAAWQAVVAGCPPLAGMEPEVEAYLVNTVRGADEHWLVGIDECYRLVAVIRREWRGLSGGSRVWTEVAEFFDGLNQGRSRA